MAKHPLSAQCSMSLLATLLSTDRRTPGEKFIAASTHLLPMFKEKMP